MVNKGIKFSKNFIVVAILSIVFLVILFFPFIVNGASNEPEVTTKNATKINSGDATLNGEVDGNGYSTRVWFEYGTNRNLGYFTMQDFSDDEDRKEDYRAVIYGLYPNTTYYFRIVAENSRGIDFGSIRSFKTDNFYLNTNYYNQQNYQNYYGEQPNSGTLTATTEPATRISNNNAQLNSFSLSGTNSYLNSWFEWGTTPNLGNRTVTMSSGTSPSLRHVHTLTGLTPGTIYYFRAVAENSYWRNNGSVLSFVTSGVNVSQNTSTNTIIIREPIIIRETITTTVKENTSTETLPPATTTIPLGASVVGTNYFLPQNATGWLVLIILFLILILEVRYLYGQPQNQKHI